MKKFSTKKVCEPVSALNSKFIHLSYHAGLCHMLAYPVGDRFRDDLETNISEEFK